MLDVMHRQHQRGGWVGLAEDAEDAGRFKRAGALATECRRYRQRQQSGLGQLVEILERKTGIAIVLRGASGKFGSKQSGAIEVARRCRHRSVLVDPIALRDHHVASNPSSPKMFRRSSANLG